MAGRLAFGVVVFVAWAACGCGGAVARGEERVTELRQPGWTDEARSRVERALASIASRSGRRVAVLDWDNTMIRGDIGDLVLARAIETDRLFTPDRDRLAMLTDAARAELEARCGARPGEPLATEGGASPCARTIAHLAWEGTTDAGEPGLVRAAWPAYRTAYGLMAQLLAGHDDASLRALAREAWEGAVAAPVGARGAVGGVELERFGRLNAPMVELVAALRETGAEVWIVSASAQPIVEELAELAGIEADRVIGVRTVRDERGRRTAEFEWLEQGVPVIPWHEGKRRWIERVIGDVVPVFAAGDSDGDLAMLQRAEARLVLDRHPIRVMCNALADPEGWIVQPLFHDPPPPRGAPYPCSTHRDDLGGVTDAQGRPIGDLP